VFCWNCNCHLPNLLGDNPWVFLKSDKLTLPMLFWNCHLLCWDCYTCVMGAKNVNLCCVRISLVPKQWT
jgi:hypothetical protein